MILITSLSVQDKLDKDGRRQAFVMELAGLHDMGEFVVEINEEIYGRLLRVYETVTGNPSFGKPLLEPDPEKLAAYMEEIQRDTLQDREQPMQLVPSASEEEVMSIQEKLMNEERKIASEEIGGPPSQFGGLAVGPTEAAMLQGIGIQLEQSAPENHDVLHFDSDDDEDEEYDDDLGELLGNETGVDQM